MGSQLRTFIAFKPPKEIRRRIDELQLHLRAAGLGVRWVKPDNIHLTLKFLGDTDPSLDSAIRTAMQTAVSGQRPLELAVGGLGGFPSLKRPRVIWLAVTGDIERLQAIQARLAENLAPCGFKRERRPFRAHLTIGRLRNPKHWGAQEAAMVAKLGAMPPQPFMADTLIWYRSQLHPEGAVYSELVRVPLDGS
jgi:2'-5' RNA ligase